MHSGVNISRTTYAIAHLERSRSLEAIWVDTSAGCLSIRCAGVTLELSTDDARALAWRLLAKAEELDAPLGEEAT